MSTWLNCSLDLGFAITMAVAVSLGSFPVCSAAIVHDEVSDGELSNDNLAPTTLNFGLGDNTVIGTVADAQGSENTDVLTFVIPDGAEWVTLRLDAYNSTDDVAFIGIDDSNTFPYNTFELDLINEGVLPDDAFIGGTTFGSGLVGSDLLPRANNVAGSGFSRPLPSGEYTVFIQQKGATTDYTLTFSVVSAVPEPSSAGILMMIGAIAVIRRRR